MTDLTMLNKFWMVELMEENKVLANGLTVKETRGKRDIVVGKVIHSCYTQNEPFEAGVGYLVWFPLYAANPIVFEGKQYLIVHQNDIIMSAIE